MPDYDDHPTRNAIYGTRDVTFEGLKLTFNKLGISYGKCFWDANVELKHRKGAETRRFYGFKLSLDQMRQIRAEIDKAIETGLDAAYQKIDELTRERNELAQERNALKVAVYEASKR